MPDAEPSLGELGRRIDLLRADIRDDFDQLNRRLDAKVSLERYQLERESTNAEIGRLRDRIGKVEQSRADEAKQRDDARQAEEKQRISDRKWLLGAFIFPTVVVVIGISLQVVLSIVGII